MITPEILGLTVALGSVGAVLRYLVQALWLGGERRYSATVLVNILGSAVAGGLTALPGSPVTVALVVGLCGAFTTFSTVALHLLPTRDSPAVARRVWLGVAHIGGSVGALILAFQTVSLLT